MVRRDQAISAILMTLVIILIITLAGIVAYTLAQKTQVPPNSNLSTSDFNDTICAGASWCGGYTYAV